jgi:uncharacterized protein YecE (DUF72 family)
MPKQKTIPGLVRIGTSNVHIPGNKTTFPPEFQLKSRLHYYSSIFNTVEVNSCFYKTPQRSTYEKWELDVPRDFQFSLKLSKEVTHAKELESDLTCMENFLGNAKGLSAKKGCLLVQFPGKISLDHFEKVENILAEIERHDPAHDWRVAVEFRNESWYTAETTELLDEFGAVMVMHDFKKAPNFQVKGQASFIYLRFHGPEGNYRGSYPDKFLKEKAADIKTWSEQGKDVYVYFNNTAGQAFENATALKTLLRNEKS